MTGRDLNQWHDEAEASASAEAEYQDEVAASAQADRTQADYVIIGKSEYSRFNQDCWARRGFQLLWTNEELETLAADIGAPILPARLVTEDDFAATIRQAKAEALREAADVFEAMTDDYTSPLSSDEAASYAMLRDNAAGLRQHADRIAAGGDPIGAGTYGCPSVYGPPPTCVLPAGHDGLHMRDVSDPSGDRPVAVEPQPEPFDMAPAEIDEFLSALEDPDGGDHR